MSGTLKGRVALVTGASRGIGEAIARAFAEEGARVAMCSRKADAIQAAAARTGHGAKGYACHVGRREELESLVGKVERDLGPVDILVNNAGTNIQQGPCLEADDEAFDKMVEVNLKSAFRLTGLVAKGMCERRRGSIINIASIAGLRPQRESLLYSMTKAALIMMTKSYALELGAFGVRVNAIAPGLVETKLSEFFWKDEERRERHFGAQALKRIGQPAEIASIAVLLAGDRASYMTGEVVVADGGYLLS